MYRNYLYSNKTKILLESLLDLHLQSLGGLAQLARALAWHARGRRFDPDTLHSLTKRPIPSIRNGSL
jgi:hypothetical protein